MFSSKLDNTNALGNKIHEAILALIKDPNNQELKKKFSKLCKTAGLSEATKSNVPLFEYYVRNIPEKDSMPYIAQLIASGMNPITLERCLEIRQHEDRPLENYMRAHSVLISLTAPKTDQDIAVAENGLSNLHASPYRQLSEIKATIKGALYETQALPTCDALYNILFNLKTKLQEHFSPDDVLPEEGKLLISNLSKAFEKFETKVKAAYYGVNNCMQDCDLKDVNSKIEQAKKEFKATCKAAITEAKTCLRLTDPKDLEWSDYLSNCLKQIYNAVASIIPFKSQEDIKKSLYTLKHSSAFEYVNDAASDLDLDNEQPQP